MFLALDFQLMWVVGIVGLVLVWATLWLLADAATSEGRKEDAILEILAKKRKD